jgi:hypothetical protein
LHVRFLVVGWLIPAASRLLREHWWQTSGCRIRRPEPNNPTAPKAQADARAGLAEARKSSIPIPAPVIEQAGKSFIEAAIRAPAAWDTAIQFVNYKSTIDAVGFKLPPQSELGKQLSPDLQAFAIKEFKGQRERTFIQDAAGRILGSVDYGVIVVKPSGSFVLDGMHIEHVVFYGGNIVYRGAVSTLLKDVAFYKSDFVIENTPQGRDLARRILSGPVVNFDASKN